MEITSHVIYLMIIAVLLITNGAAIFYLYKFSKIILNLEDTIEESLDEIDSQYKIMYDISTREIFFDSIEVRTCVKELVKSRNLMLKIAKNLNESFKG